MQLARIDLTALAVMADDAPFVSGVLQLPADTWPDLTAHGYPGIGYWPIVDQTPAYDPATQMLGAVTLTVDAANKRVLRVPAVQALTLAQVQGNKLASLSSSYQTARTANCAYMSTTFQADDASTKLLNGAVTDYTVRGVVPTGFYWRDAANNNVTMTLAQLQGLGHAVTDQGWAAFQKFQTLKAQVNAATTVAAVQAVVW